MNANADCRHCENGRRSVKQLARSLGVSIVSCAEEIIAGRIAAPGFDPLDRTYACEFCISRQAQTSVLPKVGKKWPETG